MNSRLLMPLLALWAPLVGAAFEAVLQAAVPSVCAGLLLLGLPYLLGTASRPLCGPRGVLALSREELLFARVPGLREPYRDLARTLAEGRIRTLGIVLGETEYPLWWELARAGWHPRIESVFVSGASAAIARRPPFDDFVPDAIAVRSDTNLVRDELVWRGRRYVRAWSSPPLALYERP